MISQATRMVLGVMAMATAAGAREYYVDSAHGEDGNAGTSPTAAWRSLAQVNAAKLKPGDTVRFARGGQWRGALSPHSGNEAAPITYTSYGKGEKPALLGSIALDQPTDWVQEGPNLWATRASEYRDGRVVMDCREAEWFCHRENGADVEVTTQKSETGIVYRLACRNSGTKSNHVQMWGAFPDWEAVSKDATMITLRYRARSTIPFRPGGMTVRRGANPWNSYGGAGGSPALTTEWQEFSARLNLTGRGDHPRLHFNLGGLLPKGAVFEFQPLELVETACTAGAPLTADVGNIIFDHGPTCGWKKWDVKELTKPLDYVYDGASTRVFMNCDQNPGERFGSIELAMKRHIVSQGGAHHVVYDGLALRYGAAHGFGGGDTAHLTIRNCDISYIGGGHQHSNRGRPVRFGNGIEFWGAAHDNLVEGCRIWEIYDAALTNQGRGASSKEINITYRNNIIWNAEYSFEYWNNPETAETRNILFVNNTCVNAGVVWSHAQRPDRNGSHLMMYTNKAKTSGFEIRYNIFCQTTDWGSRFSAGWDPRPLIDHNLWYEPDGHLCYWFREKLPASDIEGYRQKTGFDQHSIFADPGFVDTANGDFRLRSDSPARRVRPDGGAVGATSLWSAPKK